MRRPDLRRHRGDLSAGRVLLIMVSGLVIASLINADAMVERAEEKPLGAAHDRSLAIWHPVQDVAHVLQLHRVRTVGDALVGNDEAEDEEFTPTAVDDDAEPVRPELAAPTAEDPLGLLLVGDSVMRDFGESMLRLTADDARFDTTLDYEIGTGLTRADVENWPARIDRDLRAHDPGVVVVLFGGNDAQGIIEQDGTVHQQVTDPGWAEEYARRVAVVMDELEGRLVYWVLQPPMRDAGFDARMDILNDVYRAEAESRPWVEVVETEPLFGDGNGNFADLLPGPGGDLEDLRQADGIHLARDGADRLARHLLATLGEELSPAAD